MSKIKTSIIEQAVDKLDLKFKRNSKVLEPHRRYRFNREAKQLSEQLNKHISDRIQILIDKYYYE